jgi:hypothetical protein
LLHRFKYLRLKELVGNFAVQHYYVKKLFKDKWKNNHKGGFGQNKKGVLKTLVTIPLFLKQPLKK